jgi:hypothetical protein
VTSVTKREPCKEVVAVALALTAAALLAPLAATGRIGAGGHEARSGSTGRHPARGDDGARAPGRGPSQLSLGSEEDGSHVVGWQDAARSPNGQPSGRAGRPAAEGGASAGNGSAGREGTGPRTAGATTLGVAAPGLLLRGGTSGRSADADEALDEDAEGEPEYASIREYLTDVDEAPEEVRDVPDILGDPSNVVDDDGVVSLLAWDRRDEEPAGSYLYVLQQDAENNISLLHRYFCAERRLDVLASACVPVASVFSDSGVPVAVGYGEAGPVSREAGDLDPSMFSRRTGYVDARDLLVLLQEYFESLRA